MESTASAPTAADGQGTVAADAVGPGGKVLPGSSEIELVVNTNYLVRALDVIQTANQRLDIAQFEIASGKETDILLGAVKQAVDRGVTVRLLLDDEVDYNHTVIAALQKQGIDAKLDSAQVTTHIKFILSEQGYLIGSTNWSTTSMTKNNETNVLVREPTALSRAKLYFDGLWTSPAKPLKLMPDSSAVAALYSDGSYAATIGPILDKAKKKIRICTYAMNVDQKYPNSDLMQSLNKLVAASKRGVTVQVLLDVSGSWAPGTNAINEQAANWLKSRGIDVRLDPVETITHAKFVVADDGANDVMVVGTNNWSYSGFEKNHETGVRTHDAKATAALAAYFDKIWGMSKVQ